MFPHVTLYLIALLFWCLLAIFNFDQNNIELGTDQPVKMDDIVDWEASGDSLVVGLK